MFKLFIFGILVQQTLTAGYKDIKCDKIIDNGVIKVCYDYAAKGAKYSEYFVLKSNVDKVNIKKRPRFYREKHIPKSESLSSVDYINVTDSKTKTLFFDRGHLAPDADFDYDKKVLLKVYTMANIVPQQSSLNRGIWEELEEHERDLARKANIEVIAGAFYEDKNLYLIKRDFDKILKEREHRAKRHFSKKEISKQYKKYKKYQKKLESKHILIPTKLWKIIKYKDTEECYIFDNLKDKLISRSCQTLNNKF